MDLPRTFLLLELAVKCALKASQNCKCTSWFLSFLTRILGCIFWCHFVDKIVFSNRLNSPPTRLNLFDLSEISLVENKVMKFRDFIVLFYFGLLWLSLPYHLKQLLDLNNLS